MKISSNNNKNISVYNNNNNFDNFTLLSIAKENKIIIIKININNNNDNDSKHQISKYCLSDSNEIKKIEFSENENNLLVNSVEGSNTFLKIINTNLLIWEKIKQSDFSQNIKNFFDDKDLNINMFIPQNKNNYINDEIDIVKEVNKYEFYFPLYSVMTWKKNINNLNVIYSTNQLLIIQK